MGDRGGDALPTLVVPGSLAPGSTEATATTTPLGFVVQVTGAVLTMIAAEIARRLWRREHMAALGFLAVGLIVASFAQVHEAAFPGLESTHIASSDVLWLVFGVMLVLGMQSEARRTLRELRRSNAHLEQLKDAEVERAALEERTRLARELHDGLAQGLWLAKIKAAELTAQPDLSARVAALGDELNAVIATSLAEARSAVETLRMPGTAGGQLRDLLLRSVEEFEDRFGLRADLDAPAELPRLGMRTETELLRITDEALSNVARHADATRVTVRVQAMDGHLSLAVHDNGKGFDPGAVPDGHFGIVGMRERAALVHGDFVVTTEPQGGSTVSVVVPTLAGIAELAATAEMAATAGAPSQ